MYDVKRLQKLAGIEISPAKVNEAAEVLVENVNFSTKEPSQLNKLEDAIAASAGRNVTLAESVSDALDDITALGLKRVGSVVDLKKTVFSMYEDTKGAIWFRDGNEMGAIQETSMTLDDVKSFHTGEDIKMRKPLKEMPEELDDPMDGSDDDFEEHKHQTEFEVCIDCYDCVRFDGGEEFEESCEYHHGSGGKCEKIMRNVREGYEKMKAECGKDHLHAGKRVDEHSRHDCESCGTHLAGERYLISAK